MTPTDTASPTQPDGLQEYTVTHIRDGAVIGQVKLTDHNQVNALRRAHLLFPKTGQQGDRYEISEGFI